jgi:hypothetical protein
MGRDSAARVMWHEHGIALHEVCPAGKFREAGFINDAAGRHRDFGMQ